MTAHPWILALHILFLFLWIGQIVYVSRLVGFTVGDPDLRQRLSPLQKRLWLSPGLPGVLITGLLMLHGVGSEAFAAPRDALRYYLNPRTPAGEPSFWYITFHVKLVSFTLLALVDLWLGRQIFRLAKGGEPGHIWPLAALMGVIGALTAHVVVWVGLSELGVGAARQVGYACAALAMAGGVFGGIKLGRTDRRAKFAAAHGLAMTLILLIVALVVARPLGFGGATLG